MGKTRTRTRLRRHRPQGEDKSRDHESTGDEYGGEFTGRAHRRFGRHVERADRRSGGFRLGPRGFGLVQPIDHGLHPEHWQPFNDTDAAGRFYGAWVGQQAVGLDGGEVGHGSHGAGPGLDLNGGLRGRRPSIRGHGLRPAHRHALNGAVPMLPSLGTDNLRTGLLGRLRGLIGWTARAIGRDAEFLGAGHA